MNYDAKYVEAERQASRSPAGRLVDAQRPHMALQDIRAEVRRVQHILELTRSAMRDDLLPASVLAPVIGHCVKALLDLNETEIWD